MTQGKLMPIGSIFGTEGVAYGIRRYPGNTQHPLYNLFSLSVDTVAPLPLRASPGIAAVFAVPSLMFAAASSLPGAPRALASRSYSPR